ncbi:MAG: GNAT family N-acetyltransferase [Clostridia bacterium]|nr:GNAT family N-acetyltransferase [Clostridia bacterium]
MSNFSVDSILEFLKEVNSCFKTPLSKKQDLNILARKFYEKATLCAVENEKGITAMVAGYTENLTDGMAYISVVATLPSARGKGYAARCLEEFIEICKAKNIQAIHLYTEVDNSAAIKLYKKFGFVEYIKSDEPRPDDLHLICRLTP